MARAVRVLQHLAAELHQLANSYLGLVRQASHPHAEQAQISRAALRRGHCVDGALTKTFKPRTGP